MAVKYLFRSQDGTEVDTGFDLDALTQGQNDENTLALIQFLQQMGASQEGTPAMGVGDLMAEQRARAEMVANSLHPDAKYLPMFNPGGLFDNMAGFMGQFGNAPTLEDGQRLANRVPLETDMGALASQAASSRDTMMSAAPSGGGKYDDVIQSLIAPLIKRFMGGADEAEATPDPFYKTVSGQSDKWDWPSSPATPSNDPVGGGVKFGVPSWWNGPVMGPTDPRDMSTEQAIKKAKAAKKKK